MSKHLLELPPAVGLKATFASSWVEVIYRTLTLRELDAQQLFEEAGIHNYGDCHQEPRYPAYKFKQVWERAAFLTHDPAIGLSAAHVAFPTMYHSLSVSMAASASLQDAFDRLNRFHRLIDTLSISTLTEHEGGYKFSWSPVPKYESEIGSEAFIATIMALCFWCYGPDFAPAKVTFVKPAIEVDTYRYFFRAPVEFSTQENAVYIDEATLTRPLMTANRQLALSSEHICAEYLAQTDTDDVVNKVYKKLLESIATHTCTEALIAEELCMSLRSLQRKLHQAGTSFENLMQSVRRNLALHYINDNQLRIQEVAGMLGFSDPSNFGRAFRRWTGMTPGEYRKRKNQKIYT